MIQIKNAKELDGMRRANALSAAALKYGGQHIEAGMTTWELDKLIYDFIVKHGGTPNFKGLYGFPGTACISLNDTIIHGIPSHDIVIRPGDIVSIDTGAKVDGFNGDNACTYAVGKIDLEAQRLLDEPIGGVDPAARDYILNTIISNYSKDATVVISTHLIEDIEPVLDEAVFLKDGRIFAHRAVDDIRETEGKSVDAYFREVFKC